MAAKITVGVVGVGRQGTYHLAQYQRMDAVNFVGVYDTDGARAGAAVAEYGGTAFPSLESLLDEAQAVSMAVPSRTQVDLAREILERGVHLLAEKPLAPTSEEARLLITLAETNGAVLHVGHVERFNPAFRALRRESRRPRFIDVQRLAPYQPRGTDVSVVMDLMIHDLDLILTLMPNPVVAMDARGAAIASDSWDVATVRCTFADGAVANISASRVASEKVRVMQVFDREGWFCADLLKRQTTRSWFRSDIPEADRTLAIDTTDALAEELRLFIEAAGGTAADAAVTGIQAWKALCFAEDVEKSLTRIPL